MGAADELRRMKASADPELVTVRRDQIRELEAEVQRLRDAIDWHRKWRKASLGKMRPHSREVALWSLLDAR